MVLICVTLSQRLGCLQSETTGLYRKTGFLPGICHLNLQSREYVNQEDLTKAARKVSEAKKHESKSK